MKQPLANFLQQQGFIEISSSLPEFSFYFRLESQAVNVIHLIDYRDGLYIAKDQYELIKGKIVEFFKEKNLKEIHILSLILSSDIPKAEVLKEDDRFCWLIDTEEKNLLINENSVEDFYGIKRQLQGFLVDPVKWEKLPEENTSQAAESPKKTFSIENIKNQPFINTTLVAINVILYLICTFTGELLYNIGMLSVDGIMENKEYYRFFSAIFLHANMEHLTSNMLILLFLGNMIEKKTGHLKYIVLYFIAGLGGGIASVGYQIYTGSNAGSVGASGAVFGLLGALLFFVIIQKGRLQNLSFNRVFFVIVFSVYSGFTASNVDNAAHVGGLVTGFVVAVILYLLELVFTKKKVK